MDTFVCRGGPGSCPRWEPVSWERDSTWEERTWRLKVPGGWMVRTVEFACAANSVTPAASSVVFIEDRTHSWKVYQIPAEDFQDAWRQVGDHEGKFAYHLIEKGYPIERRESRTSLHSRSLDL